MARGNAKPDLGGLVGHLKNSALCTELDEKPLEDAGQRSGLINLLCFWGHPATVCGQLCEDKGRSRETREEAMQS